MAGKKSNGRQFPVVVEKDEDGFYIVECPVLQGCHSQGKTEEEALRNIREAIELCLEDEGVQEFLESYHPVEFSFHTISIGA